jgi:hypothetical protein
MRPDAPNYTGMLSSSDKFEEEPYQVGDPIDLVLSKDSGPVPICATILPRRRAAASNVENVTTEDMEDFQEYTVQSQIHISVADTAHHA